MLVPLLRSNVAERSGESKQVPRVTAPVPTDRSPALWTLKRPYAETRPELRFDAVVGHLRGEGGVETGIRQTGKRRYFLGRH